MQDEIEQARPPLAPEAMSMAPAPVPPPDTPGLFHDALRLHLDDRLDEAEILYRKVIEQDPGHVQGLGMLAVILADQPGRDTEAETALLRHLALRPADGASLHCLGRLRARQGDDEAAATLLRQAAEQAPKLAPVFNDLGVSLHRLGERRDALAALDHAIALDPAYGIAHGNRGAVLFDLQQFDQAVDAQLAALAHLPRTRPEWSAATLHNLLRALRRTGERTAAETAYAIVLATDPTDGGTVDELALLLEHLGRPGEARTLRNDMARRTGIRRDAPAAGAEATVLLLGGVGGGHLPTRYLVDRGIFATWSVELLSPDQPDAPLGRLDMAGLTGADVVFNTLGEADRHGDQFGAVAALCTLLGRPVLNPPDAVCRTGREQAAALFQGIPDMVTPVVRAVTPAELAVLPIELPLLVRPAGDHGGENLALLSDDADRDRYLLKPPPANARLLLTPFHNFRSPDGHWRKYRLIFVDRRVYPYHLAIGDDWLVHYWRAGMNIAPWKKAEEARFLADWRAVFGARAAHAVEQAARRLDLDYGGMDCTLLADGRLLLFEANACMRVHLDEPAEAFPYKHRHVPAIREAFSAMVRERCGRP